MNGLRGGILALCLVVAQDACSMPHGQCRATVYTDTKNEQNISAIRSTLSENPDSVFLRYRLVELYIDEMLFDEAISELGTIIDREPEEIDGYLMLALVLVKGPQTDYEGAVRVLKTAKRIAPGDADVRANLAVYYAELDLMQEAIAEGENALSRTSDPELQSSTHMLLSSLYGRLGDSQQARNHYQAAVDIDPRLGLVEARSETISIPVYTPPAGFPGYASTHPDPACRAWAVDRELKR